MKILVPLEMSLMRRVRHLFLLRVLRIFLRLERDALSDSGLAMKLVEQNYPVLNFSDRSDVFYRVFIEFFLIPKQWPKVSD